MSTYIPGTRIRIRRPCTECTDGFVRCDSQTVTTTATLTQTTVTPFTHHYCHKCHGDAWTLEWVPVETLARWISELTSLQSNQK